jgi:farnesol kinase
MSGSLSSVAHSESGFRFGELIRKLLHMAPLVFPYRLYNHSHPDPLDAVALRNLTGLTIALMVVFFACFRLVRRQGETNLVGAVLGYAAAVVGTLVLFPAQAEFASVVIAVLAVGDTAACVAGRSFGRQSLPWNPDKTWIGSVAFVVCAAPFAAHVLWLESRPEISVSAAILCGTLAAMAGAVAESVRVGTNDNLRVGVAAAAAVAMAHAVFV